MSSCVSTSRRRLTDSPRSYIKMMAVATEGGQVLSYSPRFTLTGMTGTTEKTYADAAADAGTKVPDNEDQTSNNADAAAGAGAEQTGIPLESQTGLMRYAPMQKVPPTKITKKDTKPLYPTSSYKIATTFLPTPSITKTQTASQTFSADSMENSVRSCRVLLSHLGLTDFFFCRLPLCPALMATPRGS